MEVVHWWLLWKDAEEVIYRHQFARELKNTISPGYDTFHKSVIRLDGDGVIGLKW